MDTPVDMPEAMPEAAPEAMAESEAMPMEDPKFSGDKVDPGIARYMTSDMGPFICANCDHFTGAGDCEVVSGPIDPEGVCILFTPPQGGDLEGVAEEVAPTEDVPTEPMEAEIDPEAESEY